MKKAHPKIAIDMTLDHFKDAKSGNFFVTKDDVPKLFDELKNLEDRIYNHLGVNRSVALAFLYKIGQVCSAILFYKDLDGSSHYNKLYHLYKISDDRTKSNDAFNGYVKALDNYYVDKKKVGLDASSSFRAMYQHLPDKKLETVSKIGDMYVHFLGDVPDSTKKSNLASLKSAYDLIKASDVPKLKETLYGHLYFFPKDSKERGWDGKYNRRNKEDIIFINANSNEVDRTFIHEIGHRYYNFVLEEKDKTNWASFKDKLITSAKTREYQKLVKPKVGESLSADYGLFYYAINGEVIVPGHNDKITKVITDDEGLVTQVIARDHWFSIKDLTGVGFSPTPYARTNSEEYFCELLSLYILKVLRPNIREVLTKGFREHFIDPYKDHKDPDVVLLHSIPDYFIIIPPQEYKQAITSLRNILAHVQFLDHAKIEKAQEYLTTYEPISLEQPPLYIDKHVLEFITETNKHINIELEKRRQQQQQQQPRTTPKVLPQRKVNAEPTVDEMIEFCLQNGDASQVRFTNSLANQYYRNGALSEMQQAHLKGNYLLIKKGLN